MKKLLIALLTFTVGVLTFNLLTTKQVSTPVTLTIEKKAVKTSESKIETTPTERIENPKLPEKIEYLKPFFDSFSANDYDGNQYQSYGGWFMADDFRGMKEVWTILLTRDDVNSEEKLLWSAMILTQHADGSPNDDDNFQSVWIKTENNRLSFRTNKIRGIEYKFDGAFFKNGKEFSNDEKALKGTLRKIAKGKEVAKFTADFAYHEPRCFH